MVHVARHLSSASKGSAARSTHSRRSEPELSEELLARAAGSRRGKGETGRLQVFLTLCGAALLVAAFVIIAVVFVVGWISTKEALDEAGLELRLRVAETVSDEVALVLRPIYASTRRLAEKALVGKASGSSLWPPTRESYEHNYTALIALLWTELEEELHIRRAKANGEGREFIPFLGLFANMAMKSDLRTPATSFEECSQTLSVGIHVDSNQEETVVEYENPRKIAFRTSIERGENGDELAWHEMRRFDTGTYSLEPRVMQAWPAQCDSHIRFFHAFSDHVDTGFANFSWFGPELGDYRIISGSMPFYNEEGQRIGIVHSGISVVYSINPMLAKILRDGGRFTAGAQLALVSESGRLLGASEFAEIQGYDPLYDFVHEVPAESVVGRALELVGAEAGAACPAEHRVIDAGGRLVDALPFRAERYGMPPLHERWCVVLSLPRANVYAAIDEALATSVTSGSINAVLFVFASGLLVASLVLALKSDRRLREERTKLEMRKVLSAVRGARSLESPMVLIAAEAFLGLEALEHYESLRDRGLLTVLDSLQAIRDFKQRNMIMFLSHQWLSFSFPDVEEGIQLAAMKGAVRAVLSAPSTDRSIYIWCDYTSIAQRHAKMQQAAITSLPVYASMADKFVIIAPTATHAELECECNLQTYNQRGWCRAEMLAKACGDGIKEMYTCTDTSGALVAITKEDLLRLSLNIFEGQFTVPEDVESLVKPALGLYSLVLRQRHLPHMQVIHKHIQAEKEKFFPRNYRNPATGEKAAIGRGDCRRHEERRCYSNDPRFSLLSSVAILVSSSNGAMPDGWSSSLGSARPCSRSTWSA